MTIRILLVDKRELFREGLAKILNGQPGMEVIGTCGSTVEAIEKAGEFKPNVVLLDIELEGNGCIEATKRVTELLPDTGVLILTHSEKESDVIAAMKSGARGYISKDVKIDDLIKAVTVVTEGSVIVSPPMAVKILAELGSSKLTKEEGLIKEQVQLSGRENEILELVGKGASNKEISSALFITENTVKTHLRNIMEKLRVHSRLQAVIATQGKTAVTDANEADKR